MKIILLLGLALTLVSCGQYGDLYLPESVWDKSKKSTEHKKGDNVSCKDAKKISKLSRRSS